MSRPRWPEPAELTAHRRDQMVAPTAQALWDEQKISTLLPSFCKVATTHSMERGRCGT